MILSRSVRFQLIVLQYLTSTNQNSRMLRHSCCEVRVMQLHDILQLRTSVILPEAISDGGLAPTTDTSLFLTTYRGGSHLPSDINFFMIACFLVKLHLHFHIISHRSHLRITSTDQRHRRWNMSDIQIHNYRYVIF